MAPLATGANSWNSRPATAHAEQREADPARAIQRGLLRVLARFHPANDGLRHDDAVADHG
jgi:hypothetical protein